MPLRMFDTNEVFFPLILFQPGYSSRLHVWLSLFFIWVLKIPFEIGYIAYSRWSANEQAI